MSDRDKPKDLLIEELADCRSRLRGLEVARRERQRAERALQERVKELTCLYAVQRDSQRAASTGELCQRIVEHLIPAMQFPDVAVPVIELDGARWSAEGRVGDLAHAIEADIRVDGECRGQLRVSYTEDRAFVLPEEQELIDAVAESLGSWLERKEVEEALKRSQERYAVIAHGLPNGIVHIVDQDLRYTFSAGEKVDEIGFSDEALIGKSVYDFFPPETAETVADYYEQALMGESVSFEEFFAGRTFLINAEPLTDGNGGIDRILVLSIDVTQRKRAETLAQEMPVLKGVNRIFREALQGETEEALAKTCLAIAEELTESEFGFVCELNQRRRLDTVAISDPGWDECQIENSGQVIMAQDLPVRGIRGEVIKAGRSLIFNDPPASSVWIDPPEGHPTVTAFMGVPLEDGYGRTIGMIGLANKEDGYDEADREAAEALSVAIVQALERKRLQAKLAQQAEEILDLSTPTMLVWDGVLASPLIGTLDSQRTERLMEDLLNAVVETGSEFALIDITGVPAIDTVTAQHLIETISAIRLLGAEVILTGVRPSIAQTLVQLGIDLSHITTRSSLAAGLQVAFGAFGLQVAAKGEAI